MQKIIEPIIHILYLTYIFLMGSYFLRNALGNKLYKGFGYLAVTLGLADLCYLIPRMYALLTTGIEDNLKFIGWGRILNSIIITFLFIILYEITNKRYSRKDNVPLNKTFYFLTIMRIVLCLMPPNNWFEMIPNSIFALIRFIPLALMGVLLLLIIFIHSKMHRDVHFQIILLGVFLLLPTIEPLIYFKDSSTFIIALTILRTVTLNIIILLGFKELRKITELSRY
ncbi:hypothetical protein [Tissierella sp. Yu-01]|uniref:hypothetical protein n=1 Tax=Tissierella sp. Yu-01 TaxID=3035694 RepID=UPI00240E5FB1|nr:hypothetical protein [Tissierella sp. Yu-01]WFA08466.1 hypothetical protein P3962_12145 [Tissierella sp. Yu-01]